MDKDDVYIYNEILLSHNKEQNDAICSHMDGPTDCHTEWYQSDTERQTFVFALKQKFIVHILKTSPETSQFP